MNFSQLLNGVAFGSLLMILSSGLAMIYGLRGVTNFAHGALYMAGAYLAYSLSAHFSFWLALVAPLVLAVLGAVLEFVFFRRLEHRSQIEVGLVTFGIALVPERVIVLLWGERTLAVSAPAGLGGTTSVFGVAYPTYRLLITAVAVVLAAGLVWWLRGTTLGLHIRAASRDGQTSSILGIDKDRVSLVVVCVGAALAGLAGALAAPYVSVDPGMGVSILINVLIGRHGQPPAPPLSLVGDFGGGGYLLALGVLAALLERQRSGRGQIVDAAMTEGAALLGTAFFGYRQTGSWHERGTNLVDSGAPFYDAYETADGRWLSVGALEQRFYDDLVDLLELPPGLPDRDDRANWPTLKKVFADAVRKRTRDEWTALAEGRTPCVAPVLEPDEAPRHPHHVARRAFTEVDGLTQPAPAPKFSRTAAEVDARPPLPGEHTVEALREWGIEQERLAAWQHAGAIRQER